MLACTFAFTNNFIGLFCALGSCLVFVTQNIFSKKLLFKEANKIGEKRGAKLDKMNMLFLSSSMAFVLMFPLWLYSDGMGLLGLSPHAPSAASAGLTSTVVAYFVLNGSTHFTQNIFAFNLLAMTSPVTYSIASLVKRIFVIVASIIWFGQQVSGVQWVGIILTFFGLWMYQSAKRDVERGETKVRERELDDVLPTHAEMAEGRRRGVTDAWFGRRD
ncbi:triose-phosphate transporter family-domain-containing protein [Jimgerdemannia flammicorona]|uniref:Triose-phosphate transporter family-domain-containing protein n=1 Tax=Jimgerdemannia flammicorona TaxID=994334 RepID=A0A432ZZP5_9FUNG|nr:triose-phosphate transporter family-domain-containing protein [Jimgerdemannia flammicorona]